MRNQIIQQSKLGSKEKAIVALVFGIISILGGIVTIYIYGGGTRYWTPNLANSVLIVYSLIPIIGLIFGKMSLKSTEKKWKILGMGGIILSVVGLLGTISICILIRLIASGM